MTTEKTTQETELYITVKGSEPITIKGHIASLHNDPQKIHQLLDLLDLPKGTEVKVVTKAASVIVR
ncbi:hypothetical protein IQ268_12190 [Oculatella sp. LEGE 06141]|uniref:hypothetical protein n=1 Tax=Oculatella sp. LEGE 06141 TaxID=1828648 RepID=UPI00188188D1|nr:hypothetical protein [Oculatella sp. LEGE 06141]MBE9179321.1 hypothetical protein [Oculatella sp. LEGE 06141]